MRSLSIVVKIILKYILKRIGCELHLTDSGYDLEAVVSSEHGTEFSGYLKDGKFLYKLMEFFSIRSLLSGII